MDTAFRKRERRSHQRLQMSLRCYLLGPRRELRQLVGVTENISRTGVLIRWVGKHAGRPLPEVNEVLGVAIEWPRMSLARRQRYLNCVGRVVRILPVNRRHPARVALKIRHMSFSP